MAWLVALVFLAALGFQSWMLFKRKLFKELAVSAALITLAWLYAMGAVLDWNLPGPSKWIEVLFDPLARSIFSGTYPL